eukprot:TRINITY_DN7789_c0_g1_i4.p1 TRINITY_DN7789_c0_g1~~TRINITY_DN7789_c0_g1_i4.p1  ORF type:complete len:263 (+),score=37.14 TRINITY_DN7789_c0_g1_i4:55-843(+)
MEALSLLVAGGALAFYVDHLSRERRRDVASCSSLPEIMRSRRVADESAILVVAVHVRCARFTAPQLARERIRIRVKYGEPGRSVKCDTDFREVEGPPRSPSAAFVARLGRAPRADRPFAASFGAACIFSAGGRTESVIRLRVLRAGFGGGTVIGKTVVQLPMFRDNGCGLEEMTVGVEGVNAFAGQALGQLDVAVETRLIAKGRLREQLQALDARKQGCAMLVSITPLAHGKIISEADGDPTSAGHADCHVAEGLPIGMLQA